MEAPARRVSASRGPVANREDALFVGDTVWDVKAAEQAGVACIGVCSGGISATELRDAGAVAVYADVADLLDDFDAAVVDRLTSDTRRSAGE